MWSLGCVLYFTFFGIPPFYKDNEEEMAQLVIEGKFSYPSDIPISDDGVCLRKGKEKSKGDEEGGEDGEGEEKKRTRSEGEVDGMLK